MKYLNIGVIANTHGIKGELKIKPLTNSIEQRFVKGKEVIVRFQDKDLKMKIKTIRENKGLLYILFDGITNINEVEQYKGSYIVINSEDVHELDADEAYHFQLIGCTVVTTEGETLGVVSEVIETGANDILRVKTSEQDRLIPFVKNFVVDVNVKEHLVVVALIEGL